MRFKSEHVSMNEAIELGSLEIRKLFKDLNSTALDKKVNMDYLEKELGLRKFFPQSLLDSHKVYYLIFIKQYFNNVFFFLLASCSTKMY
jgi:focal adhesion kinase 1